MSEHSLVIGASLYLAQAVAAVQDPRSSSRQMRTLRRVITAALVELRTDSLAAAISSGLLERLAEAFDGYEPVERDDLLSLAAEHAAAVLESLGAGRVDATAAWATATSAFEALDDYRQRRPVEPFFAAWLEGLRASLHEVVATTRDRDVMDAAQEVLDAALALAHPYILEAYEVGVLEVDDWEAEL